VWRDRFPGPLGTIWCSADKQKREGKWHARHYIGKGLDVVLRHGDCDVPRFATRVLRELDHIWVALAGAYCAYILGRRHGVQADSRVADGTLQPFSRTGNLVQGGSIYVFDLYR
jgi:hypothetical protein